MLGFCSKFHNKNTMPNIDNALKRPLVVLLCILLGLIILIGSFPNQSQWFIARTLVNSAEGYDNYIQSYPKSPYLDQASWRRARLKNDPVLYLDFAADFPKHPQRELALWTAAKKLRDPAVYAEYLKQFPEGNQAKAEGFNVNRLRISATVYNNEQKRLAGLNYGKVVDSEGHTYRSIQIGKLTWLADNLNLNVDGASSCFLNHEAYCDRFGKLYNWLGAQDACAKLGEGWRLPSLEEWETLCLNYDPAGNLDKGSSKVFQALLKGGKSGLEARGGGYFTPEGGFIGVYFDAAYWTSSPANGLESYEIVFLGREKRTFKAIAERAYALSCRCVRN